MKPRSPIQENFTSYADCEFLSGEPVVDDDGKIEQSVGWLLENRFDDFLDEISDALMEQGVRRAALMRVFLRHALRILNDDPDAIHAGSADNNNPV